MNGSHVIRRMLRNVALTAVATGAVLVGGTGGAHAAAHTTIVSARGDSATQTVQTTLHEVGNPKRTMQGAVTLRFVPDAVRPMSAFGCNQDVCIEVNGSSTYVASWNTYAFGNVGCTHANYLINNTLWTTSAQICPETGDDGECVSSFNYEGYLHANDKLCNTWVKIAGKPCETIER
jgi:hypothetical protein